jgi:phosphohistidine phosphatase
MAFSLQSKINAESLKYSLKRKYTTVYRKKLYLNGENMKKIVFIRHGKSSWSHNLPDIKRPLKEKGLNDGKLVSEVFKNQEFIPDMVFSSPAVRANTTCNIFLETLKIPNDKVLIVDALYDFAGQNVIKYIQNLNNDLDNIMLFGHNYAFTSLVNALGNSYIDNLPTTGLVLIEFDTDSWKDLTNGISKLIIFPKNLR